jgi:hypothetical protein
MRVEVRTDATAGRSGEQVVSAEDEMPLFHNRRHGDTQMRTSTRFGDVVDERGWVGAELVTMLSHRRIGWFSR